jgi:hypothetical protein
MKIETAALHYGAPVRVFVADDSELPPPTGQQPTMKKLEPQRGAWAWAAGIARTALGLEHETTKQLPEIEIR